MNLEPFPLTERLQRLQQPYPPDPQPLRRWQQMVRGWFAHYMRPPKTFIFCLSPMRSGSTLLKALLGQAPDIAHLPEYDFQRYHRHPLRWYHHAARQSPLPRLLFKLPAPVRECTRYPLLPLPSTLPRAHFHYLVLVREPAPTIASLLKMHAEQQILTDFSAADWLAYWGATYTSILRYLETLRQHTPAPSIRFVHYEQLVANPLATTRDLFAWLGSAQQEGVAIYTPPDGGTWRWGKDDAGTKIHSAQVQRPSTPPPDEIVALCASHPQVAGLWERLIIGKSKG